MTAGWADDWPTETRRVSTPPPAIGPVPELHVWQIRHAQKVIAGALGPDCLDVLRALGIDRRVP